ncbi:MAG: flagellar M-ring protein FliF [Deltaproteobacteria bacterium]|nr:flagellar M-ring protein FliF [Deltaproteobacteria bacterium]
MAINEISAQLKTLLGSMTPAKMFTLLALISITIVGFVFLLTWSGESDFQPLYSNLTPEDAGAILTRLKEKKIPYKVSTNRDAILVPSDQLYEIRLELASQGLPLGSGVGFEIFDNAKLGMSEFVQNVNYQRALQGELSRTIDRFDEVQGSRIHIVMGSKSLFVEDQEPATASVILKLAPGRTLNNGQVQAIVHLVSSSVSGLKTENVTVVDNYGKMLAGRKDRASEGPINSDQLALQEKMEKGLESRVRTMLETALGPGKAIARISCALDFRKQEKTEERYHPDDKAVRSEQILNESTGDAEVGIKGVPGFLSNTTEGQAALAQEKKSRSSGGETFNKKERTVNYEISKVTSHTVEPYPKIVRVSTAVMVDGVSTYSEGKDGKGEWKYSPRSDEEMTKLQKIVKRAVNFDSNRGDEIEVINIPFSKVDPEWGEGEQDESAGRWFAYAKQYGPSAKVIFLVTLLFCIFLFVVRPLLRWLTAGTEPKQRMLVQLPKTLSEIENEYGTSPSSKDKAVNLIASDEENSLKLVRRWLSEEKA